MRARLTYLVLSPRTPALVANQVTQLLVLLAAAAGLAFVVSGSASYLLFSGVLELGELMGAGA